MRLAKPSASARVQSDLVWARADANISCTVWPGGRAAVRSTRNTRILFPFASPSDRTPRSPLHPVVHPLLGGLSNNSTHPQYAAVAFRSSVFVCGSWVGRSISNSDMSAPQRSPYTSRQWRFNKLNARGLFSTVDRLGGGVRPAAAASARARPCLRQFVGK